MPMRKIKLKLLLDENISPRVARILRDKGYDAASIAEDSPGISDNEVLKKTVTQKRVLITLDKDFGALVFAHEKKHVGVIYIRLSQETPAHIAYALLNALTHYQKIIYGFFMTVTDTEIRIRR